MEYPTQPNLKELLLKYLERKCTREEKLRLYTLLMMPENEFSVKEILLQHLDEFDEMGFDNSVDFGVIYKRIIDEIEVNEDQEEKKDKIDDAVHATKAAVAEGIVSGGGVALVRAIPAVDALIATLEGDEKIGATIVRRSLEEPLRQIVANAGEEGAVVVAKVLESKDPHYGYNAQTSVFEDLVKAGVIDPTKVTRTALQNAASIAGLLLTTEAQNGATGKQITRDHAQSQADTALSLAKSLGEVATKQLADTLEHGPETISPDNAKEAKSTQGHLKHHIDALKAWEAGSNTDQESKTKNDEPGRQPIMVLSAPAGIAALTAQNLSLAAGTNFDQIAQRDTNQTSGRRWLHNVGQHLSLFVNGVKDTISLKLIAAKGKVQMQAQHGEIEVTAEKDITLTACKGKVTIPAKKEVLLTSGGAYIRIKDGNIEIHCPDAVSMKAASHQWLGPAAMQVPMPQFPQSEFKRKRRATLSG